MTDIRDPITDILQREHHPIDVLLINVPSRWVSPKTGLFDLPFRHLEEASQNSLRLYGDQDHEPNHGLLLICSVLRKLQIQFHLVDLHTLYYLHTKSLISTNIEDYVKNILCHTHPKIVALSSMTPSLSIAQSLAKQAKSLAGDNAYVVVGGLASTDIWRCFSEDAIDIVVVGEAEYTFPDLTRAILQGKPFTDIAGIAYKRAGRIIVTPEPPLRGQRSLAASI